MLIFASTVTLALNVGAPLVAGQFGKAAFDAVGPLLLIGWAEVGPGLLQALSRVTTDVNLDEHPPESNEPTRHMDTAASTAARPEPEADLDVRLLEHARQQDALHWHKHRRPISAETLRKNLGVGSARSRALVSTIRAQPTYGQ